MAVSRSKARGRPTVIAHLLRFLPTDTILDLTCHVHGAIYTYRYKTCTKERAHGEETDREGRRRCRSGRRTGQGGGIGFRAPRHPGFGCKLVGNCAVGLLMSGLAGPPMHLYASMPATDNATASGCCSLRHTYALVNVVYLWRVGTGPRPRLKATMCSGDNIRCCSTSQQPSPHTAISPTCSMILPVICETFLTFSLLA